MKPGQVLLILGGLSSWNVGVSAEPATAPAAYWMSVDQSRLIYDEGTPVSVRVQAFPKAEASAELLLQAHNAWGEQVFRQQFGAPPPGNPAALNVPAGRHRYLKLRLSAVGEDETEFDVKSILILPRKLAQDRRFGFNTHPEHAALVRRLGGVWVRAHIPWEQGGPDQPLGTNGISQVIAAVRSGGCELFGISSYSLPWASIYATDDQRNMKEYFSVPRPEPWDAYIVHAARQIRGKVPVFEVWNEPNLDHFWASVPNTFEQRLDDYAALLKRSYALAKQEAPEALITNGSIVNSRSGRAHEYFRGLLDRGAGQSFDILNIHYYRGGNAPEAAAPPPDGQLEFFLQGFRDALRTDGLTKPVWMTEMGWSSTDPGWGYVNEFEQMCYLVRSHVLCFAGGVEVVLWFKLEGEPFGIWDPQLGAKPALAAYAQLVRALAGKSYRQALAMDNCRVYVFSSQRQQVAIAWAVTPARWPIPPGFRVTRAENALGEPLNRPIEKGALNLTKAPVYLYGRFDIQPSP